MKSILFDFGGTLDSDGLSWGERFYPIYKEMGLQASRDAFNKAFWASDDRLAERFALRGLSLEATVLLQVRCVLEALAPDRLALAEPVAGRFLEDCRRHFRRNRPLLQRLAGRYRLGIVSNFYGNLEDVLRSEGLFELFAIVSESAVVGALKPDAKLFLHAVEGLKLSPADCLMVGDSVPRDMRGAEGIGMAHALLGPSPACCERAWRLAALPELESRLAPALEARTA